MNSSSLSFDFLLADSNIHKRNLNNKIDVKTKSIIIVKYMLGNIYN